MSLDYTAEQQNKNCFKTPSQHWEQTHKTQCSYGRTREDKNQKFWESVSVNETPWCVTDVTPILILHSTDIARLQNGNFKHHAMYE